MANTSAIEITITPASISISTALRSTEVKIEIRVVPWQLSPIQTGLTISPDKFGSTATVSDWRRVAKLARIAIVDEETGKLSEELNSILAFVDKLSEVNVDGVEPMTSVTPMQMKRRPDVVAAGGDPDAVLRNAPAREGNFFVVPKVVE